MRVAPKLGGYATMRDRGMTALRVALLEGVKVGVTVRRVFEVRMAVRVYLRL